MNTSKWKLSMDKSKSKRVFTNILDYSKEEGLPILTPKAKISIFAIKEMNIAIIGTDAYRTACKLKDAQVFAVSIRDLEYQAEKETIPETGQKKVVPEEYYDLLNIFFKKNSDTVPPYRK